MPTKVGNLHNIVYNPMVQVHVISIAVLAISIKHAPSYLIITVLLVINLVTGANNCLKMGQYC